VVEGFISYILYEKRFSQNTVTAYQNDLLQFATYLERQYEISAMGEVNHLMVRSWLVFLMESGISARSVNRKLTTLKSFFRYLVRTGKIEMNPMARVISPRTSKRLPVFIEKDRMESVFRDVDFGEGYTGLRNRVIVELFYVTGMRLSELVNLRDSDIDVHRSTIKVLGKRNKERLIPFGDKTGATLKAYLIEKKIFNSEYLFVTEKGKKIYPKLVYRIVIQVLSQVTTLEKKSPHILRHTFATHLLNNGADLNAVKELLGHGSLAATQVYTHNTIDKLKKIYEQAHPKA
jgi:integrase/recombinase XerC